MCEVKNLAAETAGCINYQYISLCPLWLIAVFVLRSIINNYSDLVFRSRLYRLPALAGISFQ